MPWAMIQGSRSPLRAKARPMIERDGEHPTIMNGKP